MTTAPWPKTFFSRLVFSLTVTTLADLCDSWFLFDYVKRWTSSGAFQFGHKKSLAFRGIFKDIISNSHVLIFNLRALYPLGIFSRSPQAISHTPRSCIHFSRTSPKPLAPRYEPTSNDLCFHSLRISALCHYSPVFFHSLQEPCTPDQPNQPNAGTLLKIPQGSLKKEYRCTMRG